jgi:hypothetical protein
MGEFAGHEAAAVIGCRIEESGRSKPRRYSRIDLRLGSRAVEAKVAADIDNDVLVQVGRQVQISA